MSMFLVSTQGAELPADRVGDDAVHGAWRHPPHSQRGGPPVLEPLELSSSPGGASPLEVCVSPLVPELLVQRAAP